ncbi:hypothetical protein AB0H76_09415 [Nocardia sp. NPDC050712]|uniref:hypothetical protein n=1 Tax=Nocardia sp. NPDC050712 TaxID=3155518 RepID=UPI0033F868DD
MGDSACHTRAVVSWIVRLPTGREREVLLVEGGAVIVEFGAPVEAGEPMGLLKVPDAAR